MTKTAFPALPDPNERPTLPVYPDAAHWLGLSKSSAYAAAERGEIPTIRIGRRLLVPTAALRRLLQLDDETTPAAMSTSNKHADPDPAASPSTTPAVRRTSAQAPGGSS